MKFSSKGALVLLSLFVSGSSWPGPPIRQVAAPEVHAVPIRMAHVSSVLKRDVQLGANALAEARPTPVMDLWLTVVLSGAVVALQLRRTQRSVRVARVAAS
jgi:hypothetical protein